MVNEDIITVEIKRTSVRKIRMKLTNGTSSPLDLTTALGVRFQMRGFQRGILKMDRAAEFIDRAGGIVEVTPDVSDTDTPGQYFAEWRVTYPGGDVLVPDGGYIRVHVLDDLAG
jgi:hypothetical protein